MPITPSGFAPGFAVLFLYQAAIPPGLVHCCFVPLPIGNTTRPGNCVCAPDISKQTPSKIISPNTNILRKMGSLLKITLALVQALLMLQYLKVFLKINCLMFFYSMQKVPYLKDWSSQLST